MIANNTYLDRLTIDFFDNFNHQNRVMKIFNTNPVDGFVFNSEPFITFNLTNDSVGYVNGRKTIKFNSTVDSVANVPSTKTAPKWFVVYNYNGEFIFGGRVGNFLHGMPLNFERLVVEHGSKHTLKTFEFRFVMGDE